jgi:hypothetical protein
VTWLRQRNTHEEELAEDATDLGDFAADITARRYRN